MGRLLALAGIISVCAAVTPLLGAASSAPSVSHAMGSSPCVWGVPLRQPNGALDVNATIRDLRNNGFDCYVHVIESAPPNSFQDFKRLLPAAQAAGISVWPVLIPPSEAGELGGSMPYKGDYVQWMKTLAELSLKYPALRGVNIDDLLIDISSKKFNRSYLCKLYKTKQDINPKLLFVPTIYDLGPEEADRLQGCVDGVWLWWVNLEHNDGWRSLLEDSRIAIANRFPIYGGVYAHSTSWHKEGNPSPKVLKGALETACRYANGALIWNLPLAAQASDNPLLQVARSFASGGSEALAGECGASAGRK